VVARASNRLASLPNLGRPPIACLPHAASSHSGRSSVLSHLKNTTACANWLPRWVKPSCAKVGMSIDDAVAIVSESEMSRMRRRTRGSSNNPYVGV